MPCSKASLRLSCATLAPVGGSAIDDGMRQLCRGLFALLQAEPSREPQALLYSQGDSLCDAFQDFCCTTMWRFGGERQYISHLAGKTDSTRIHLG